jgi:molybdopterin-guanine dinucleotide biosynthesis protein A
LSNSAIILAGGFSSRFGQDKGLIQLAGKPLINHVLERITNVVDEKIVVVSSKIQAENYQKAVDSKVNILVDKENMHGPLVGALTGLEEAHGIHALLLPCDTPLLSKEILSLLLELCVNKAAVIPRWPNCYIEPLQAAYATEPASEAARNALGEGKMTMQSMVDRLQGVRYVSTLVLQQFDPELKTFFNVNTPLDLKKAELIFKREKD